MGIKDESWCVDCGKSQPYSEDDVVCGQCTSEAYEIRSNKLVEYMKLHLTSLEQDSEKIWNAMDQIDDLESDEYEELNIQDIRNGGEIAATNHILKYIEEVTNV